MAACIHCEKTDQQVPLLQMVYQGKEVFICPQCLPLLIHKPEKLEEKLPGMQPGKPAEH
jgi:recombinational DNA repair protein (RecF pathway)